MARISAYEASDKTLHRDRKAWMRHEANLLVAEQLRAILTPEGIAAPAGVDEWTHAANLAKAYDVIVDDIGLNTLRDLFAIKYKPTADEGDDAADAADAVDASGDAAQDDEAGI